MKLVGDYHTHSTYTHGVSSIEENVISAINKGLGQIAITEHAYKHMSNGITRNGYKKMKAEIEALRIKYPQIEILCGLECNLMGFDGKIDIDNSEINDYDIIVLGYHYTYKPYSIKNFFNFFLPSILKIKNKKRIEKNTQAYITAIEKNQIDILAHLNYGIKVDPIKIAKVAVEKQIYIELNGKRINFSDEEIKGMIKTGVKFIINSDAHNAKNVGKNNQAYALIERLNIPNNQIINLKNYLKLKRYNVNKNY